MPAFELTYHHYSERSILVSWPPEISKDILNDVLAFKSSIENSNIKQILQVNNAYNSILVVYEFTIDNINDEISSLKALYAEENALKIYPKKLWHIPVCYDLEFGQDLSALSQQLELSIPQIISLHSRPIYTVYFLGFLPGFMYLGGLPEPLYCPRKSSPRSRVPKGAVAIGREQTGVYPMESPGGWNIIGNTPIDFFDVSLSRPCFAQAGDQIKFEAVSPVVYQQIKKDMASGVINLKSEEIHG